MKKDKLSNTSSAHHNKQSSSHPHDRSSNMGATRTASHQPEATDDAVLLRADEIFTMRKASEIESPEQLRRRKEYEAQERKERQAAAEARKEKIRSMEATRIANIPKTQLEQEDEDEKNHRRQLAKEMRDETMDDIKKMNSILNYAITATIRERQIAEKKEREAAEKAADRMRDLQAEIEALEVRKKAEEAEMAKHAVIDRVKQEMVAQVHEAINRKKAQREAMKQDEIQRKLMLAKQLEADAKAKEQLMKKKQDILNDTIKLNEQAIEAKKQRKLQEIALDRKIDAEAAAIVAAKEAAEAEKERQRKLREEAEFKVRGEISKFYDDTEKREEMLMRRAYEEGERREREKALVRARAQAAAQADLHETRVRILAEKQTRMAEMIDDERAEFERAIRLQEEWLAQEKIKEDTRNAANAAFLKDIRVQVKEKEERLRTMKQHERKELDASRAAVQAELDHLRQVRDRKLEEMKALGLPAKYMAELTSFDPEKAIFKREMDRPIIQKAENANK